MPVYSAVVAAAAMVSRELAVIQRADLASFWAQASAGPLVGLAAMKLEPQAATVKELTCLPKRIASCVDVAQGTEDEAAMLLI